MQYFCPFLTFRVCLTNGPVFLDFANSPIEKYPLSCPKWLPAWMHALVGSWWGSNNGLLSDRCQSVPMLKFC